MSNDYEYRVSVIVPVYNAEKFLEECLNSLVMQNIEKSEMEILLINDGSTDSSLSICNLYESLYENIKVITKENSGVSDTRNMGIKLAKGKYIMFLDSDDTLEECTILEVVKFFDSVYDKTDLVTYKIVPMANGKPQTLHFRYNYYKDKSEIYDLNDFPYVSQTTMNICVKNTKEKFFDTKLSHGEDQKFITDNLTEKLTIGYCAKGQYHYIKHAESAVSQEAYAFYLFNQKMNLWEELFGRYEEDVPKYVQAMVLANYSWELPRDCIFPYHFEKEEFEIAMDRIRNIITRIDNDIIMNHPAIDVFHKYYWISMKKNIESIVICENDKYSLVVDNVNLYSRPKFEIVVNKVNVDKKGKFLFMGFVKSPIFNFYAEKPDVYVYNGENVSTVDLFDSISSHYKSKAKTNNFWGFRYETEASTVENLYFKVGLEGILYDVTYYFMPAAVFNKAKKVLEFVRQDYLIQLKSDKVSVSKMCDVKEYFIEDMKKKVSSLAANVNRIRSAVIDNYGKERIWIYCDSFSVGTDNAYLQFQHDWEKKDGIKRYYIYAGNKENIESKFTEEQKFYMVQSETDIHKILFLSAEYVLTSFSDLKPRVPFRDDAEYALYRDMPQPDIIYLQHGVLHADLRFTQSAERCKVDQIVVSTYFEIENYMDNYNYSKDELIPVGMPRYDFIDFNRKPERKILFAPSWRSYLMSRGDNTWNRNEKVLLKSDYFKKFRDFLMSEELNDFLKKNDIYLDAKMHQNMRDILEVFGFESKRIRFVQDDVHVEEYGMFITDMSSYVFDYAELCRPIIYFVPDMMQFKSGMNHYRQLDLPFEKAFGNLVLDVDTAIAEVKRVVGNNFTVDDIFKRRMENFYLPLENCREHLYEYLI